MTYNQIKNTIYWIFIASWIGLIFFYYFNVPIHGDYWIRKWGMHNIYSLAPGFHPGRHFGELMTFLPRVFSSWFSIIPEPLYRYKFATSLFDTFLIISLSGVTSYIISTNKKMTFLISLLFFFYTNLTWTVVNAIAVLPMLYISMVPAILYLKNHTLPQWMIDNPYKTFGYWAAFCYMGSQVYDPVYFVGVTFFGMNIIY